MHIIYIDPRVKKAIPTNGGGVMEPGQRYIATNAFTGALLSIRTPLEINDEENSTLPLSLLVRAEPYTAEPPTQEIKTVILMRGGGFGDLLAMTPLIRALKKKWGCQIIVACGNEYQSALFMNDNVDGFIALPIPIEYLREVRLVDVARPDVLLVDYEEWIEGYTASQSVHMAQRFADKVKVAGMTLDSYKPDYKCTEFELESMKERYPKKHPSRIAVQVAASAAYRTYPKIGDVVTLLIRNGHEVVLFGIPGRIEWSGDAEGRIINASADDLSFRQSAALLSTCDGCIAPDSAFTHLAAALEIPCIGIYGPFPASLRVSGSVTGIETEYPCAPCFYHAVHPMSFPTKKCHEAQECLALAQIEPSAIVDALEWKLKK